MCYVLYYWFCVFVHRIFLFFFFKQKTAYVMRISDWSSDVCSSDLAGPRIDDDQLAAVLGGTAAHGEMPQPARAAHQCAHRQPRIGDALVGLQRSEERRAGKECVSTRISWWSTNH